MNAAETPPREAIEAGGFCTVRAAAQRLGLHVSAVYKLCDSGALAFIRPTGRDRNARRVSVVSLDHHISKNLVIR